MVDIDFLEWFIVFLISSFGDQKFSRI